MVFMAGEKPQFVGFRGLNTEMPLFKTMIEEARLPLLIADTKGRIVFANRWLKESIGYTLTESLQDGLQDLCAPYEQN